MTPDETLTGEHKDLYDEARAGIERLAAHSSGPMDDVVFLVADADSALGKVIIGLGVPRPARRRSVVMPLTRADAVRAAGPLTGPSLTAKLTNHPGPVVLVMAGGTARLVGLPPK